MEPTCTSALNALNSLGEAFPSPFITKKGTSSAGGVEDVPKDTVVMAFSLSPRAAAYVRGAGHGRKSALVDRCILYYKDNRVQDLLDQIAFMEGNIAGLQSKLLNDPQPLGVEEEKRPGFLRLMFQYLRRLVPFL